MNLIHENAEHMPFSVNVVKQLHSVLSRYVSDPGGRFKPVDNDIVERRPDGTVRVRFRTVPAVATNQAMDDLVAGFDQAIDGESKEPLVVAPLAILDFLCIHPFRDGNGRIARLLTLLLLYRFGYQVGRYISLERDIEESKETYYEALERSSQRWHEAEHDPIPWLGYFWGMLLRAHRELEDRVGTIRGGRGSKTAQIRAAVQRRVAPFAISDLEDELPAISRDMIRNVLRQLRDEGVIEKRGEGRGTKWLRRESA